MDTNKSTAVKQSGNDVEGYQSQKVLFQSNVLVFLQYYALINRAGGPYEEIFVDVQGVWTECSEVHAP